jgi:KaiC/GvpD/RAD55 family RecA-like ATPase
LPRIPLIEELTTGVIPAGSNIVVEYEPASQWYAASIAITAGWLKQGGTVSYTAEAQSPDSIRNALKRLGIDTAKLEAEPAPPNECLRIWDF